MDTKPTLVLVTATQFVLNWIEVFEYSLRRHNPKGTYHLVILTFPDSFDRAGRNRLRNLGVELFEREMINLKISRFSAEHGNSLNVYRIKHLGKAFLADAYLNGCETSEYGAVLVSDLDIIFQAPLNVVTSQIRTGKILGAEEYPSLRQQPFLVHKLCRAKGVDRFADLDLDLDRHEINFGFLGGKPDTLHRFVRAMSGLVSDPELSELLDAEIGRADAYHEQDFMRLYLQATGYEDLALVDTATVAHLCHMPGSSDPACAPVAEASLGSEYVFPAVLHFAGGVWPMFQELRHWLDGYDVAAQRAEPDEYLGNLRFAVSPQRRCVKTVNSRGVTSLQCAWLAYEEHRFADAAREFGDLHDKNPKDVDSLYGLAVSLLRTDDVERGQTLLEDFLRESPHNLERRKIAARVLEGIGQDENALKLWQEIAAAVPEQPMWIIHILRLTKRLHGGNPARKFFRKTVKQCAGILDPASRGECLEMIDDFRGAMQVYATALNELPSDAASLVRLLGLLRRKGEPERAAEFALNFLDTFGDHNEVRQHLAAALYEAGDQPRFIEVFSSLFERGKRLNPGLVRCYARSLLSEGRRDESARTIDWLVRNGSGTLEQAPFDSGLLCRDAGLLDRAAQFFDMAAQTEGHPDAPLFAAACLARLGSMRMNGDKQGGCNLLFQARSRMEGLMKNGRTVPVLDALCDVLRDMGDFGGAEALARELSEMDPEKANLKRQCIRQARETALAARE